jgi:uncharacterized protein YgbK (DUF1537 family)
MRFFSVNQDLPQTQYVTSRPDHIYLLADDLTGACDAAVAFLPAGYSVRVWMGPKALRITPEQVQAFNTNSRSLTPVSASLAVSFAMEGLTVDPHTLFFKKIDSSARGSLATELLAAHHALATQAVLVAPSFPAAGRTVSNGILEIQDASGQHSQLPLASLFPAESMGKVTAIHHSDELAEALGSGKSILLCDAVTQADLEALAQAATRLSNLLYAGSAGLAQALASLYSVHVPPEPLPVSTRTLIVTGTPHAVTKLQLDRLADSHPTAHVFSIHSKAGDEASIRAEFQRLDPQALILTGGDTAVMVVRALEAHSLILHGEFAPGIPWGIVQGGAAEGRIVITKSGGFGAPTAFSDILNTLSGTA